MPKFLFWNLNKSERRDLLCRLARLENVDVIILAESALHTARFLEEINDAPQHYHYVPGVCGHITLFARFHPSLDDLWPTNIADSNLVTPISILKRAGCAAGRED